MAPSRKNSNILGRCPQELVENQIKQGGGPEDIGQMVKSLEVVFQKFNKNGQFHLLHLFHMNFDAFYYRLAEYLVQKAVIKPKKAKFDQNVLKGQIRDFICQKMVHEERDKYENQSAKTSKFKKLQIYVLFEI